MTKGKSLESLGQIDTSDRVFDIAELFHIDETDLDTEFRTQAGWYAFFSNQLAMADFKASQAKAAKERAYAAADLYYREDYTDKSLKITESAIRSEVLLDDEYADTIEAENVALAKRAELQHIVRALAQRADMLISLGAHRRAELDMTGMSIREQGYQKMTDDLKDTISKRKKEQV